MLRNSVDGLIVSPIALQSETISILRKTSAPVLLLNNYLEDPAFSCVTSDNFQGGCLAAEHILSLPLSERKQIIAVTGFKHQTLTERMDGFRSMADPEIYEEINTYEDGLNLVPTLITRNKINQVKTCLFITNDNVAMGVQEGLLRHQLSIPGDVRMVGYDNIDFSARCRIPLTTIEQSPGEMGRIAGMEILDMIDNPGGKARKFRLPTRIIIRESSPAG
jgi:DNA-binding LacI/PurR family transcriptional regulator